MARSQGPVIWLRPGWGAERLNAAGLQPFADPARLRVSRQSTSGPSFWGAPNPEIHADQTNTNTNTNTQGDHDFVRPPGLLGRLLLDPRAVGPSCQDAALAALRR